MSQENNAPASENGAPEKTTPSPETETSTPEGKDQGSVPYSRFKEVVEQRKATEETLKGVVDELVNGLPEEFRGLVPNLPPAERVAWMRQAREAGLFKKAEAPAAPELDTKRPGGKPAADLNSMNASQLLSAGYK